MVFLQPKASVIKSQYGVCLLRAFVIALWSGITGRKPTPRKKKEAKQSPPPAKSSQTASSADVGTTGGTHAHMSGSGQAKGVGILDEAREGEKAEEGVGAHQPIEDEAVDV